jgi:hypothetical protein
VLEEDQAGIIQMSPTADYGGRDDFFWRLFGHNVLNKQPLNTSEPS